MFKPGHIPTHKGRTTTADPLRTLDATRQVTALLQDRPRDLALWLTATHTALRAGDLVRLTWDDLHGDDQVGFHLRLLEGKTKKPRVIPLPPPVAQALLAWRALTESDHIYAGQRGPLTTATWSRMVKGWCQEAGHEGSFSSHTCRKTWVRVQLDEFKTPLYTLMHALNHATERQTLVYAGRLTDDVARAYNNTLV